MSFFKLSWNIFWVFVSRLELNDEMKWRNKMKVAPTEWMSLKKHSKFKMVLNSSDNINVQTWHEFSWRTFWFSWVELSWSRKLIWKVDMIKFVKTRNEHMKMNILLCDFRFFFFLFLFLLVLCLDLKLLVV